MARVPWSDHDILMGNLMGNFRATYMSGNDVTGGSTVTRAALVPGVKSNLKLWSWRRHLVRRSH